MKYLFCLIGLMFFTSCATIINDKTEFVPVRTNPIGATVSTDGQSCKTPCSLQLHRGRSYVLTISKEGFEDRVVTLDGKSWDSWLWGNLLIGGLIGLGVDFATDKGYDFDPEYVDTSLVEKSNNSSSSRETASK